MAVTAWLSPTRPAGPITSTDALLATKLPCRSRACGAYKSAEIECYVKPPSAEVARYRLSIARKLNEAASRRFSKHLIEFFTKATSSTKLEAPQKAERWKFPTSPGTIYAIGDVHGRLDLLLDLEAQNCLT